jgi:IclR family pca regulon transcriptional regulator
MGYHCYHGFDLLQAVKPIIDKTFLEHNVSIDSALLFDHTLISLYRREVQNLIHLRLPLVMTDLHARAMGKAVLANLDPSELSGFLKKVTRKKLTTRTIIKKDDLLIDLETTKKRWYSINNEEYVGGLICIGAPLKNFNSQDIAGAVSLDFPASEYSLDSIERNFTGILTKLASELSAIAVKEPSLNWP